MEEKFRNIFGILSEGAQREIVGYLKALTDKELSVAGEKEETRKEEVRNDKTFYNI